MQSKLVGEFDQLLATWPNGRCQLGSLHLLTSKKKKKNWP